MKFSEIAGLEAKELWAKLGQLRKELFDSRIQLKMRRLSNPLKIRFLRRDIARIQTALSMRKKDKAKGQAALAGKQKGERK